MEQRIIQMRELLDNNNNLMKLFESNSILNEDGAINKLVKGGAIVGKDLENVFNQMKRDTRNRLQVNFGKTKEVLTHSDLFAKLGVNTADDLVKLIKNDFQSIDNASKKVIKLTVRDAGQLRGAFELNVLKSSTSPGKLLDAAAENLVKNQMFINKYKAYGNETDLINALKKAGYSDQGAKAIAKTRTRIGTGPKPKPNPPDPNLPPPPIKDKTIWERIKDKLKGLTWKQMLGIAAGAGLGVMSLWYFTQGENIEDRPIDPPIAEGFPECVQELVRNGEAQLIGTDRVQYSAENLTFYLNNRVQDNTNNKMGTYKCKGTQIAPISEQKKLSLYEIAMGGSGEIDLNTMTNYVDTAVDDLDGYVDVGNLNSLYSIVSALKGKTFQGKNALQQFMMLYSQDEGGDDFKDDVNSVGVRVLGTKGIVLKNQILDILSGGGGSSEGTTTGEKIGLKNIEITWDDKKIEGGGGGGGTQPKYFDCSQKDFPYQYGCIAPKIAEIQTCLGVTPNKGYFGPKTKRELGYSVITKDLYDKIMAECGKGSTTNYDAIKQAVMDRAKKDMDAKGIGKFKPEPIQKPSYVDYVEPKDPEEPPRR